MGDLPFITVGLSFFVLQISLVCFFEWKLAQKEEWYLGLILPALCFWNSLPEILMSMEGERLLYFLGGNIETIVLLLIYKTIRTHIRQKQEMQRMKVKDLS